MRTPLNQVPFPIERRKEFIKQFTGPDEDSNVVCFRFWQLAHAWGCPYECAYCFLQTTPYARFRKEALTGLLYNNWRHMLDEVEDWLTARTPRMLIVGELQDGLAFDNAYAKLTGKPLTHHLIPLFAAQSRHRLIFLTKSVLIGPALQLQPTPQVVFSWSVNAEYPARRWEHGTPAPARRFKAARQMKEKGWPVRFRLDPMIPFQDGQEHWRDGYSWAIDQINAIGPEMVTLGTLRASNINKGALRRAAEQNGRPTDLFDLLSEKDPSGFKYRLPLEQQIELYRFVLERLDRERIKPALCKEDATVWQALGLRFSGCHCLLGGSEPAAELVSSRGYTQLPEVDMVVQPVPVVRTHVPVSFAGDRGAGGPVILKLEARPGTYALVFASLEETTVQIGRLGEIHLLPGWYVYISSALAKKTGVLRRLARHADPTRPKKWNVDHVKHDLRLLETWYTHDPARRECTWSTVVGSLSGAEVHLRTFGSHDCRAGCPAHFYYFASRPSVDDFCRALTRMVPDHAAVGHLAAGSSEELAAQLAALVGTIRTGKALRAMAKGR